MPDLSYLKAEISALFAQFESRCLHYSGGSDSRLLLEVMLETQQPFGILTFKEGWSKQQHKQFDAVVMAKNLQVFSYPAVSNTLVGENGEVGLVSQYAIDGYGNTTMLIRDLVDDPSRCAFDIKLQPEKRKIAPADWDVHILGLRLDDEHWLKSPLITEKEGQVGSKKFLFPLAEWSQKEVRDTLKTYYGVDLSGEIDTGNVNCCHSCLKTTERVYCPKEKREIDAVQWDKAGNTAQVREFLEN